MLGIFDSVVSIVLKAACEVWLHLDPETLLVPDFELRFVKHVNKADRFCRAWLSGPTASTHHIAHRVSLYLSHLKFFRYRKDIALLCVPDLPYPSRQTSARGCWHKCYVQNTGAGRSILAQAICFCVYTDCPGLQAPVPACPTNTSRVCPWDSLRGIRPQEVLSLNSPFFIGVLLSIVLSVNISNADGLV